jgi:hypothetical protein
VPSTTPPVKTCPTHVPHPGDGDHHGPGGNFPGHGVGGGYGSHYPGAWGGPRIDGHYLWLDQNLGLDVCSDSNYGGWYSRNSSHRDGILRLLGGNPNQRWAQLHQSCGNSGVSVSSDGQCVTYRTDALRYGNELNTVRRDWSGLRLRLLSAHRGWNGNDLNVLSLSERNDWNRFRGLDSQRYGDWNRSWGQLQTVCSDPTPPVVILQSVAPVSDTTPADVAPATDPAPAVTTPAPSGVSAGSAVPSGPVQTGGDSPAYVLAHARVA